MSVAETRDKVQRILTKYLGSIMVVADGDFQVQHGSTACAISVRDWGDGHTLVRLMAPVLRDAPASPELFRWVTTEGQYYRFGTMTAVEHDDGTVDLYFDHTLLGTFLDEDELMVAFGAVITTADALDDELEERFGGKKLFDVE